MNRYTDLQLQFRRAFREHLGDILGLLLVAATLAGGYFTLFWESADERAANAAADEARRVARADHEEAVRRAVIAETPTPRGTAYTIVHESHWYTIVGGGYREGTAMNHHPDCPCGKKEIQ